MFLRVSFCDHHQGARIWAWLKLQLLKIFGKVSRYGHAVVWQLHVHNVVFLTNIFNNCNFSQAQIRAP